MMTPKKNGKRRNGMKHLGEETEDLPVRLTEAERLERGGRLAQLHEDLVQAKAHTEMVKRDLKAAEARIEEELSRLAAVLRQGSELRPVQVTRWADYDRGTYEEVREDTGELIPGRTRPLRPAERQGYLPLPEAGDAELVRETVAP